MEGASSGWLFLGKSSCNPESLPFLTLYPLLGMEIGTIPEIVPSEPFMATD